MSTAWIEGRSASFEEAVAAASDAIRSSRLPVVTGLASDVAGIKAAIRLAQGAGAVLDHGASQALQAHMSALTEHGMILGAPAEVRRRADRVLVIGRGAFDGAPELPSFLFSHQPDLGRAARDEAAGRRVLWLGAPDVLPAFPNEVSVEAVRCPDEALPAIAAAIRAALGDRRFGETAIGTAKVREIAEWLGGAEFGCAIWSCEELDALDVETLAGLVVDLNRTTRFTSLSRTGPGQAYGAAQIAAAATGLPLRTGFGRGFAEHDPLVNDARRLVQAGETDLVVYLSALADFETEIPDWTGEVPVIALVPDPSACSPTPRVAFAVATAGRDHDGVLFEERMASFAPFTAEAGARTGMELPSAARVLTAIAEALGAPAAAEEAA
ncbi:hypothetical protein [Mangrovicella endophytica]|uniref:hypothetical protein n=1 Tax=Mangrovicella endophytica TaxID=2066697 RepID=UPI000C9DAE68|nr:hypothetical protein [Mangrovicella endophytica]